MTRSIKSPVLKGIKERIRQEINEELKKPLWAQWANIILSALMIILIYLLVLREHILYIRIVSEF